MPSFLLAKHTRDAKRLRNKGFTAVELMVTVAIVGVLAALAAPSFSALIERWRITQTTDMLKSTLHYARSEAIKRGGNVLIQKSANNTNGCTTATGNADWDCGWFVCEDTNGNGTCSSTEPVLQRYETPSRVQVTRTGGGTAIKLNRWGLVDGTWVGFSIVPLDQSVSHPAARGVCMSAGGRIRTIRSEELPCTP